MADDGYRLETLLELRRGEEAARQQELATAVAATMAARAVADAARGALVAAQARRAEAVVAAGAAAATGRASAGDLVAARRFAERLAGEERAANERVQVADDNVRTVEEAEAAARDALALAASEREAIEKHRAQWDAERRREQERRAELAADDLANRRKG